MNHQKLCNQHGSTLVESLVALSLLGLTAAAIGNLLSREISLDATNGTSTTAISLAEQELEDLRAQDYDAVASRSSTNTVDGATYNVQTTVVPDSPAPDMKSVTTTVTWTDVRGPQSYDVYTIYGAPPT
jgi:type II secretory pathway pseudopilin PulG